MTFAKLAKDYSGLETADIGKVIDKELLVGLKKDFDKDKHPTADNDIGIYELYMNDDWDGDGISNYIEVENSKRVVGTLAGGESKDVKMLIGNETTYTGVQYVEQDGAIAFDPLKAEDNAQALGLIKTTSRGVHGNGEMLKHDAANVDSAPYSTTNRIDGLRIPNRGKGYYYSKVGDPLDDIDNYATLKTLQIVEEVGRKWEKAHPDLWPLHKDEFCMNGKAQNYNNAGCLDVDNTEGKSGGKRFGVLDFSRNGGGYFFRLKSSPAPNTEFVFEGTSIKRDHGTHQNGLDIDLRYVSKESVGEKQLIFDENVGNDNYSKTLTMELMGLFVEAGATLFFVDPNGHSEIGPGVVDFVGSDNVKRKAIVIPFADHENHFHVQFPENGAGRPFTLNVPQNLNTNNANLDFTSNPIKVTLNQPPINGTATAPVSITIKSSVIRDDNNWVLMENEKIRLTAVNSNGATVGSLHNNGICDKDAYDNRWCKVTGDGTLVFDYTTPAQLTTGTTVTIKAFSKPGDEELAVVQLELIPAEIGQ